MTGPKTTRKIDGDALLQALVNASVDGIIVIDREGIVHLFSAGAQRMFGYRGEEVLGQNVSLLMTSEDRSHHDDYLQRYHRTGERHIIGIGREVRGRQKDGEEFPLDLSVGEATDAGLYIGILRDLRQREHLEQLLHEEREQVRDLERSLAHVHRASTLGEMAAGIAHEINQPLAAISSYADAGVRLLSGEPVKTHRLSYALEQIGNQARRAGKVVQRMREMAGQDAAVLETVAINDLIGDLLELARLEARELDAPITLDLADNLPPVRVDPVQIQQVLLNLIRNGLEAMVKRSQARLGLKISSELVDPQTLRVCVTDHGVGVDPDQVESIFNAFHTSKPTGMGMGLSICRTIVRRHNGRLWYEPVPTGGSRFLFTLPVGSHDSDQNE